MENYGLYEVKEVGKWAGSMRWILGVRLFTKVSSQVGVQHNLGFLLWKGEDIIKRDEENRVEEWYSEDGLWGSNDNKERKAEKKESEIKAHFIQDGV